MTYDKTPSKQVHLSEITAGILRAVPDVTAYVKGVRTMLKAGPDSRASIGSVLEKQARRYPDNLALKFGKQTWSYGDFNRWVNRVASLFLKLGINTGDVVGILSENRAEVLVCTAAAAKVGAIAGMLNYNQREEVLEHSLALIKPKVIITGQESTAALDSTSFAPLKSEGIWHYWIGDDDSTRPAGYESLEQACSTLSTSNPSTTRDVRSKQPCFYIFTSGTTGMPKASVMSHSRWLKGGAGMGLLTARLTRSDVFYVPLPLYHNNALTVSWGSVLNSGACMALTRKFSVSQFWGEVRQFNATGFCYIGELCRYLLNSEPTELDRDHRVRLVVGNGLRPEIWMEFKDRFGIERICEFYGASECNLAFVNSFDVDCTAGFCPYPFAVVQYDSETEEPVWDTQGRMKKVDSGGVGLLITKISKLAPFDGYTDAKASEKKILRDVFKPGDSWFNTGDLVRDQGYKHIQFVDRLGDTFRWKGENVATTEVEAAFKPVQQIEQAVVYGVQVPNCDGRAGMAAITLKKGETELDTHAVASAMFEHLPVYAIPLFLRVRNEHEITGTFKNRKVELKNEAFDLQQVNEPLYVIDLKQKTYMPLTATLQQEIEQGNVRF